MPENNFTGSNIKIVAVLYVFVELVRFFATPLIGGNKEGTANTHKTSEMYSIITQRDSTGRPLIYTPEKSIEIQRQQLQILKDISRQLKRRNP